MNVQTRTLNLADPIKHPENFDKLMSGHDQEKFGLSQRVQCHNHAYMKCKSREQHMIPITVLLLELTGFINQYLRKAGLSIFGLYVFLLFFSPLH